MAVQCLYWTGSSAYCCAELPVPVAAESSHAYYYRPCHGGGNDVLVGLAEGHAQECNRPVQFLSGDVSLLGTDTLLQHETLLLLEVCGCCPKVGSCDSLCYTWISHHLTVSRSFSLPGTSGWLGGWSWSELDEMPTSHMIDEVCSPGHVIHVASREN